MVKTHPYSTFSLKSLDDIRNSTDVILQINETGSTFSDTKKQVYLCEVVPSCAYSRTETVEMLTREIVRINNENRRLIKKIERLEKIIVNAG